MVQTHFNGYGEKQSRPTVVRQQSSPRLVVWQLRHDLGRRAPDDGLGPYCESSRISKSNPPTPPTPPSPNPSLQTIYTIDTLIVQLSHIVNSCVLQLLWE
ncbi:hypothetical protein AAHA92_21396 [Salvia divinorum]|uniref:Uncharacterized protein n=1 Tax=Salvia divinorum TaxID=28513 RepID=A0ABD1GKN0_SALDI